MATNFESIKKKDDPQIHLIASKYRSEIVNISENVKCGIYNYKKENLFHSLSFFAQYIKYLPECSNEVLDLCRACLILIEVNSSDWDLKNLNKLVIICTTLVICRKEENVIRDSCNVLNEILLLIPPDLLCTIVQKHYQSLKFIFQKLVRVQSYYTQMMIISIFVALTQNLKPLRNDFIQKNRLVTRARKEVTSDLMQSLDQIDLQDITVSSRNFLNIFNTKVVSGIFILSTEGYIAKINETNLANREIMNIDFNGRNLTISFFVSRKMMINMNSGIMTEYGDQAVDKEQLVLIEIECENIEAHLKNFKTKSKINLDIVVRKATIIQNDKIQQKLIGLQKIVFAIVDSEKKLKCFMDVFYNKYKSNERMVVDGNNSVMDQESLMSYHTNASFVNHSLTAQTPLKNIVKKNADDENNISSDIDNFNDQIPKPQINYQKIALLRNNDHVEIKQERKIEIKDFGKTVQQTLIQNENGYMNKNADDKFDDDQKADNINLKTNIKSEKIQVVDVIKNELILKKPDANKVETSVLEQKPKAKRGRKPAVKKNDEDYIPRPKRQSRAINNKVKQNDDYDLPNDKKMPSFRDFIINKREEKQASQASQLQPHVPASQTYHLETPKVNTKYTQRLEQAKKSHAMKTRPEKRSRYDTDDEEEEQKEAYDKHPKRRPLRSTQVPNKKVKYEEKHCKNESHEVSEQDNSIEQPPKIIDGRRQTRVSTDQNKSFEFDANNTRVSTEQKKFDAIRHTRISTDQLEFNTNRQKHVSTDQYKPKKFDAIRHTRISTDQLEFDANCQKHVPIDQNKPKKFDANNHTRVSTEQKKSDAIRLTRVSTDFKKPIKTDLIQQSNFDKAKQAEFLIPKDISVNPNKRQSSDKTDYAASTSSKNARIEEWIEGASQMYFADNKKDHIAVNENCYSFEDDTTNSTFDHKNPTDQPISSFTQAAINGDLDNTQYDEFMEKDEHQHYSSSSNHDESDLNEKMQVESLVTADKNDSGFESDSNPGALFRHHSNQAAIKLHSRVNELNKYQTKIDKKYNPTISQWNEIVCDNVRQTKDQLTHVLKLNKQYNAAKKKLMDLLKKKNDSKIQLKSIVEERRKALAENTQNQMKERKKIKKEANDLHVQLKNEIWRSYVENLTNKMSSSMKKAYEI